VKLKFINLIVLSFLIALPSFSAQSATPPKSGAICSNVGKTQNYKGLQFTCIKSGKKLVWNKGVKIKTVAISPTPIPSASPTPVPTTSVTPSPSPSISASLSPRTKVAESVLDNWRLWRSKASQNYTPLRIITEPGYSSSWTTEPVSASNILMSTFIGNGYFLLQDPIAIFGDSEVWLQKTGAEFSCGGKIPDQVLGIYCGRVQAGYGHFILNLPSSEAFINDRKLTSKQIVALNYMVAHDVATMFELQSQYGDKKYDGTKYQIPAWIREGFVQLFSSLAVKEASKSPKDHAEFLVESELLETFPRYLCARNLQDFESKDRNWGSSCISSQNLYAVELLAARHGGFDALFKFVSLFGASDDWTKSFKDAFGLDRADFYTEWYEYLGIPTSEHPALKPAAPPSKY
jgi:hypothetical protein